MKFCIKCGGTKFDKSRHCKKCAKETYSAWRITNKQKLQEKKAEHYQINKDRYKNNAKAWQERNAEKEKVRQKNRRLLNPQENKVWRQNNHAKSRTILNNYRAKKRINGGKLSGDIALRLIALQKERCACCGEKLNGKYHLDHIVPVSRGGMNEDLNIQILHPSCNQQKGAKSQIDFMRSKGFLL